MSDLFLLYSLPRGFHSAFLLQGPDKCPCISGVRDAAQAFLSFFSVPLEVVSCLQHPTLYPAVCTTCNVRDLWISLLKGWFYAMEYNEHEVLFAWIAATVINSLKKHPGNSFRSFLSTYWPQTGNHMKKCREGKHGLIQENRNHMVKGGKINKAVLLKQRIPSQFSSHLFSSSAFFIRDYSFPAVGLFYSCKRVSLSCCFVFLQATTQQKWNFLTVINDCHVNWQEGFSDLLWCSWRSHPLQFALPVGFRGILDMLGYWRTGLNRISDTASNPVKKSLKWHFAFWKLHICTII